MGSWILPPMAINQFLSACLRLYEFTVGCVLSVFLLVCIAYPNEQNPCLFFRRSLNKVRSCLISDSPPLPAGFLRVRSLTHVGFFRTLVIRKPFLPPFLHVWPEPKSAQNPSSRISGPNDLWHGRAGLPHISHISFPPVKWTFLAKKSFFIIFPWYIKEKCWIVSFSSTAIWFRYRVSKLRFSHSPRFPLF